MKRLRNWYSMPGTPPSRHPYRDAALVYAVMALAIVGVTALTDGNLTPGSTDRTGVLAVIGRFGALPVAGAFFVVATAFSWWRLRVRESRAEDRK